MKVRKSSKLFFSNELFADKPWLKQDLNNSPQNQDEQFINPYLPLSRDTQQYQKQDTHWGHQGTQGQIYYSRQDDEHTQKGLHRNISTKERLHRNDRTQERQHRNDCIQEGFHRYNNTQEGLCHNEYDN